MMKHRRYIKYKYYYTYVIKRYLNNVWTGHYYYGQHRTNDLNDGYMGSGYRIQNAIHAHGVENFKKEILAFYKSFSALNMAEVELITMDHVNDPLCYNLMPGGQPTTRRTKSKIKSWDDISSSAPKPHKEPIDITQISW